LRRRRRIWSHASVTKLESADAQAAHQGRGQRKPDDRGHGQRQQRRHGIADAAHQGREQDEGERQRHRDHHDARVGSRGIENVVGRGERRQKLAAEQPAEQRDQTRDQQGHGERGTGNGLDLADLACTPGLADQDAGARADPHHEGDEEEHDGKEHGNRGERADTDHLAEIDAVDGAEQRLQNVAQHHRRKEDQERLSQRQDFRHGLSLRVGVRA
jgi:hypothetical protein